MTDVQPSSDAAAGAGAPRPPLTAEELLARNIVPVKLEYRVQRSKSATSPPTTAKKEEQAQSEQGKQAGDGAQNDEKQSRNNNKSRKQMRKDARSNRVPDLCTNHAMGRCTYGDKCRFNHDLVSYVQSKPVDLPGTCPWTALQSTCPYGITCRYALTHTATDDQHVLLRDTLQQAKQQQEQQQQQQAEEGVQGNGAAAVADGGANGTAAGDGAAAAPPSDIPTSIAPLPHLGPIEKESNVLPKDVQAKLWKNRYDFARADAVLKSMGVQVSRRQQPKHEGKQQRDGKGQQGQEGEAAKAGSGADAAPEAAGASEPLAAENGGGSGAMAVDGAEGQQPGTGEAEADGGEQPAAKRQRTEQSEQQAGKQEQGDGVAVEAAAAAAAQAEAVAEARAAHVEVPLRAVEKKALDFRGKTYLAPLTTVGNLPFRRVCKGLGVDITCGEMALATNLLQGHASEWALLKRHPCEDFFGVQVCGGFPDALARCGQLLGDNIVADFIDINMGCPIDLVCDKSAGSALLRQPRRIEQIIRATSAATDIPITFKTRKGYNDGCDVAHTFLHQAGGWGAAAVTLHGRTRQQRYSKLADWEYIKQVGESCSAAGLQLLGNGDILSYTDWNEHLAVHGVASAMIGRGALIKPWIFTEIKEQRHWDISASERLDLYRQFCAAGLEHWGSDSRGVENTRRFLLEWLSFTCRYVPVGLLEVLPQQMNHRPPAFCGRSDLETLFASDSPQDWLRISEMLLGPAPASASGFTPKHKSNSYAASSELDMARG